MNTVLTCNVCKVEVPRDLVEAPCTVNALPDVVILGAKLTQCPKCKEHYFADPDHFRHMTKQIAIEIAGRTGRLTDKEKLLLLLRFKNRVAPELAHMSYNSEMKFRALLTGLSNKDIENRMLLPRTETLTVVV